MVFGLTEEAVLIIVERAHSRTASRPKPLTLTGASLAMAEPSELPSFDEAEQFLLRTQERRLARRSHGACRLGAAGVGTAGRFRAVPHLREALALARTVGDQAREGDILGVLRLAALVTTLRTAKGITGGFSHPSPCPLPVGESVQRTVIPFAVLTRPRRRPFPRKALHPMHCVTATCAASAGRFVRHGYLTYVGCRWWAVPTLRRIPWREEIWGRLPRFFSPPRMNLYATGIPMVARFLRELKPKPLGRGREIWR